MGRRRSLRKRGPNARTGPTRTSSAPASCCRAPSAMPSLTRTAPPSGWLNIVRRVPLRTRNTSFWRSSVFGAGLEDHLDRQTLVGKPLRRQHAVTVDRVIGTEIVVLQHQARARRRDADMRIGGRGRLPQSRAQVPNRPNCWNNSSTDAALAAAGKAVANASTMTAAIRMTSPLRRLEKFRGPTIAARRASAIDGARIAPLAKLRCDFITAGKSASPPSPLRRMS